MVPFGKDNEILWRSLAIRGSWKTGHRKDMRTDVGQEECEDNSRFEPIHDSQAYKHAEFITTILLYEVTPHH